MLFSGCNVSIEDVILFYLRNAITTRDKKLKLLGIISLPTLPENRLPQQSKRIGIYDGFK